MQLENSKLSYSQLEKDNDELRKMKESFENRVALLSSEIERLGVMIKNKNNDNDTLKTNY